MANAHRSVRRVLVAATALGACAVPVAGSTPANAYYVQAKTGPSHGCVVPGTDTVRPCIVATPNHYIP